MIEKSTAFKRPEFLGALIRSSQRLGLGLSVVAGSAGGCGLPGNCFGSFRPRPPPTGCGQLVLLIEVGRVTCPAFGSGVLRDQHRFHELIQLVEWIEDRIGAGPPRPEESDSVVPDVESSRYQAVNMLRSSRMNRLSWILSARTAIMTS